MGDDAHEKNGDFIRFYMIGFLTIPAFAESYNWGFNKGKNGNLPMPVKNLMKCCRNMKRFIKGIQRKKTFT